MAFFLITMSHPDGDGWATHLKAHIDYLEMLVDKDTLRASGPLKDTRLRTGFLIILADNKAEVEAIVAKDPFAIEGLIEELTIIEWDPLFGAFSHESSRKGS